MLLGKMIHCLLIYNIISLFSSTGNVQRYTVQCVLPINMYTEKIYTFLWFWMVFVAAVSVFNLLTWLVRFLMPSDNVKYIKVGLLKFIRCMECSRKLGESTYMYLCYLQILVSFLIPLLLYKHFNWY